MTNRGDDRTPDKTIGQIKYADGQKGGTDKEARHVVEGGEAEKTSSQQQSQKEGPAAYAPHTEEPKKSGKLVGVVGDNDLA
jgi:hypothetical protein